MNVLPFEDLVTSFENCQISDGQNAGEALRLFINKLSESYRNHVKRSKERCLEEAFHLLKQIPEAVLRGLEERQLLLLVRLLLSLQLQAVSISTACRKVDQMVQHLSKLDYELVLRETRQCLLYIVHTDQVLSCEDLQKVCMFLEDSAIGLQVWQELHLSLVNKVSELFSTVLQQGSFRDGPLCYAAVKVCLQMFQLLSNEIAALVWDKEHAGPTLQTILQALIGIILGKSCHRDTRLLAGTAVAMLINRAPESQAGGAAAWSLLQVIHLEPWLLSIGNLQVQCNPTGEDVVDTLAVSRGLLTCCQPHILLSPHMDGKQIHSCLLLEGLFPLIYTLCQKKMDCLYLAFEVLTLWLKRVKECLTDIWSRRGVRLLSEDSILLQQLTHIIWTNAECPVEGVSESVRAIFGLLLELYEMDCKHSCDTKKSLYFTLLKRIIKQPWEAKAKYQRLCALLPYLGPDVVLDRCAEIPNHLLKCLSINHLAPCGSELYKCLIQQERRELLQKASFTEVELADRWSRRWRPFLHEALTSDVTLLQNNSSALLLPCTFQLFPSAVDQLLDSLDPFAPGHLHAWACIVSSYRATTGGSPWSLQGSSTLETLQLALESADDKVRLAALNILCCSLKTKDTPTTQEMSIMRTFITQNLNSESSPFRQHLQAGLKKFLVRIRDGCLARVRGQKSKKKKESVQFEPSQDVLEQGIGFVEWLGQLPYCYLAPGHSYQRKKTALLLLSAVLETCTDSWSPDKKKGQPPANIAALINYAKQKGKWDFFCRGKLLILITCLEDSTNEIRELSAWLLLKFFQSSFPDDITVELHVRSKQLLCSPRVQEAQMGALMMKVLLQKSRDQTGKNSEISNMVGFLVRELKEHYLTARADMMLAARTKPIHGVLLALQRCLSESPGSVCVSLGHSVSAELLKLLEDISLLLLGVLYGDVDACLTEMDAPPSFCDMGNAIKTLIVQASGGGQRDEEECVLLSEEHSLVLTCCWVSLKEIGIFLGSLVETMLSESKSSKCCLTKEDLCRASQIFQNILLKCRHWGAVEGCCMGFTKFCVTLLSSGDAEIRDIPAVMLEELVRPVKPDHCCARVCGHYWKRLKLLCLTTGTKRSICHRFCLTVTPENRYHPLTTGTDAVTRLSLLLQVCAVHTMQALVRGSGLGVAVLQFAPDVAILSLTLLSSPCWAMRNAALQLFSSLCTRMLGQRPSSEEDGHHQHGMSPLAFFYHYPGLQLFLLTELSGAAQELQGPSNEAKLHLHPSLFPILTLLAQLQPGVQDTTETLSSFLPPLLQLSASPIYSVRVMASKALVAMAPPSEYMSILSSLIAQLPSSQEPFSHNQLHGQLLQIRAVLERALCSFSAPSSDMNELLSRMDASLWLVTEDQHCPLVRAAYLGIADTLRKFLCETYLSKLNKILMRDLQKPQKELQIGLSSFYKQAVHFLCADSMWACPIWSNFSAICADLQLLLVMWVIDGQVPPQHSLKELIQRVLEFNLREAILSHSVEYRKTYLAALATVLFRGESSVWQPLHWTAPRDEPVLPDCVNLLLGDLEDQRCGSEFLSEALCAASLLLSQWPDSSLRAPVLERWCSILENHRSPESPEVLRMSCAEALCVAGVSLGLREHCRPFLSRLIGTGLWLLQDQSHQVRMKTAQFASMLHHTRRGRSSKSIYVMQVNKALQVLLDLLLEECWEEPGTLKVLLSNLPQVDLRTVAQGASHTGCASLYEQDEPNVFSEPSVMCVHMLPYLLQMAEKYSESSSLGCGLSMWVEENAAQVLNNLRVCKELLPADNLTSAWLALLLDPRLHSSLCSLFAQAVFVIKLLEKHTVQHLCDPLALKTSLQEVHSLLSNNGIHFPSALTAAVAGVALVK
ncbi:thyroid adenoma-associated protein homolog isoform X2 [Takifugu rubripes]|uniref:thyroid adenoma-associated protein homolog isoform X2 n=1 Tax=Takifugu rubripes TaxID=31033 RepID=UPI001145E346|nr:thyroid adenoma-associated protein homolog isoform X2 [Takifugu rubripes]